MESRQLFSWKRIFLVCFCLGKYSRSAHVCMSLQKLAFNSRLWLSQPVGAVSICTAVRPSIQPLAPWTLPSEVHWRAPPELVINGKLWLLSQVVLLYYFFPPHLFFRTVFGCCFQFCSSHLIRKSFLRLFILLFNERDMSGNRDRMSMVFDD